MILPCAGTPLSRASLSSRCHWLSAMAPSMITLPIDALLERVHANALVGVDKRLVFEAFFHVELDDVFHHIGDLIRLERRAQFLADTGFPVTTAAQGDLVELLAFLVHTENTDVANVVVTTGVHATGKSAQAALSYVRTNANQLGIFSSVFEKTDIHIHVPAGAVPKDGPSAGVTIATSLISAFTSIPVRKDVAMTGEITLRGKVLAIGGLKEKLLASKRGLISTVMIPHNNKKNLSEIPDEIQKGLKIIPVQTVEEVLEIALEHLPTPVIDAEGDDAEKTETESPEVTILPQTESPESPRTYDA